MERKQARKAVQTVRHRAEEFVYSVLWSDEDKVFVARVVEFPSLAAHGKTQEGALREIRKVVEVVLEDLKTSGEPVPEPLSKRSYSGRLNLRMPAHLHRHLTVEAEQQGVSLNQWINTKLALNIS